MVFKCSKASYTDNFFNNTSLQSTNMRQESSQNISDIHGGLKLTQQIAQDVANWAANNGLECVTTEKLK